MTTEQIDTANLNATAKVISAPYMSGTSFLNQFNKFSSEGLPEVFDGSYFGNVSGSVIAQTRGTLKFFELIDDEYRPTDLLTELVAADEETRRGMLKLMVEEKYPDALALSLNATSGQLAKVFQDRGLNGATVDKAIGFYLHMADYVGIAVSPLFKKRRSTASSGASRRKRAKPAEAVAPPAPPTPRVTTEQEQKSKYVSMLMELASKDDADAQLQRDLLDRIEKALGIGVPPDSAPSATTGGGNT